MTSVIVQRRVDSFVSLPLRLPFMPFTVYGIHSAGTHWVSAFETEVI